MCTPSNCINMRDKGGGYVEHEGGRKYKECLEKANGKRGLECACTTEVWKCLKDPKGGNCLVANATNPVDEAGSWCSKYVVHQDLGCNPILCGPIPSRADELPSPTVAFVLMAIVLMSIIHMSFKYHASTAAWQQAFGTSSNQKKKR
eukprot:TRINITY_DN24799_c0_g1_i1.p1 TRINITY_DN24799_c0_g1~~TRINITY_DN24799_c0_g1_i1.p1  ORF type:complete len:170 (+),score=30.97 TRINITY_DN24799_c0_g1_i1:70-510(+)